MVKKIGHRGAMGYMPENTLISFEYAINLGVDMVELDVFQCRSGELVVIHDETVDRTTSGTGYVQDMTYRQLRNLDAGRGQNIPTLEEVLDQVNRRVEVNIELKGPNTAEPVYQVVEKYIHTKGWKYSDFLISSFNHNELKKYRELSESTRIGALFGGIPLGYTYSVQELNPFSVNLCLEFINPEFVEDAHNYGNEVYVWTVDSDQDIKRMKELKIQGIFSNYPDRI